MLSVGGHHLLRVCRDGLSAGQAHRSRSFQANVPGRQCSTHCCPTCLWLAEQGLSEASTTWTWGAGEREGLAKWQCACARRMSLARLQVEMAAGAVAFQRSPWDKPKGAGAGAAALGVKGELQLAWLRKELAPSFCRQGTEAVLSTATASAAHELSCCQLESPGKGLALRGHAAQQVEKAALGKVQSLPACRLENPAPAIWQHRCPDTLSPGPQQPAPA